MFLVSPGTAVIPRGNEKQWLCIIWGGGGANKVYYGRCENGDPFSLIKKVQEIIHVTLTVSLQSCQWEMRTGRS